MVYSNGKCNYHNGSIHPIYLPNKSENLLKLDREDVGIEWMETDMLGALVLSVLNVSMVVDWDIQYDQIMAVTNDYLIDESTDYLHN